MPFPQYGANLYALNSLGEQWLNQTVTLATFRGPPIVLVTTIMSDTDSDILAVIDFANYWNGPIVGFDRAVPIGSWSLTELRNAGLAASKFFTMAHTSPFALPIGSSTVQYPITGPWLSLETGGPATSVDAWDAIVAGEFIRTTQNHPYGCGMQAVSVFTESTNGPPLYGIGLFLDVFEGLTRLQKKWAGESVPTVSQYQALGLAAAIRPGLARLCNAALLPELIVVEPV
jgi:hypothetical protein